MSKTTTATPTEIWEEIRQNAINNGEVSNEHASFMLKQGTLHVLNFSLSKEDKEDIVQKAFLAFYNKVIAGEYDAEYSPASFFLKTVHTLCLSVYRDNKNHATQELPKTIDEHDDEFEYMPLKDKNLCTSFNMNCATELFNKIRENLSKKGQHIALEVLIDSSIKNKAKEIGKRLGLTTQAGHLYIQAVRAIVAKLILEEKKNGQRYNSCYLSSI